MTWRRLAIPLLLFSVLLVMGVAASADDAPLAHARPGQWTLHREVAPSGERLVYAWVEKVDDEVVTVLEQELSADRKTARSKPAARELSRTARSVPAGATVADETLEVAGKKLACKRIEHTVTLALNKVRRTLWRSSEVPILGVVREVVVREGKPESRKDLLDWGEAGGAARPMASGGR